MGKGMWYEQRDGLKLKLVKCIEDNIIHRELNDKEYTDFATLFDDLIEPYTEGDWHNYN